ALKAALLAQPMGRGMPLPPPGTPLPGPQKSLWASSGLNLSSLKRKPVGSQAVSPQPSKVVEKLDHVDEQAHQPPPLPARPRPTSREIIQRTVPPTGLEQQVAGDPDLLVVAAPVEDDSMPNTPTVEVDHSIPTHAEEAQVAPHIERLPKESNSDIEQPTTEQKATREVEPKQAAVQELAFDPQHNHTQTVTETTEGADHDERHDTEDGETSDSLEAADVAGEVR
ncbi:hypothetical protein KCU97_g23060, partial [Aureobasidium melanogenum]